MYHYRTPAAKAAWKAQGASYRESLRAQAQNDLTPIYSNVDEVRDMLMQYSEMDNLPRFSRMPTLLAGT